MMAPHGSIIPPNPAGHTKFDWKQFFNKAAKRQRFISKRASSATVLLKLPECYVMKFVKLKEPSICKLFKQNTYEKIFSRGCDIHSLCCVILLPKKCCQ